MIEKEDLSPPDFIFNPKYGFDFKSQVRDLIDLIIRRPFYKARYKNKFKGILPGPDLILPEKGLSTIARRKLLNNFSPLEGSRLLVLGCGTGWDLGSYLCFVPREIVCVDLFNYSECWKQITEYVQRTGLKTKINFLQADITEVKNLKLDRFDVISSDAVFEHCIDFEKVMLTSRDLLVDNGIIYSSYGPLWYCFGGDHLSGHDSINNGFNHLILDSNEYKNYCNNFLNSKSLEIQEGLRFIKSGLFSKLRSNEYIEMYKKLGFNIEYLVCEFSINAINALKNKSILNALIIKYPRIKFDEYILKSHIIVLKKIAK